MKFAVCMLIAVALILVLSSQADAGVSRSARPKPGSCPNSRGFGRSSHGGNGGGVGGGNGGIGGGNGNGRRCRSDGECYGVQKCCSSACVNPVAVVG